MLTCPFETPLAAVFGGGPRTWELAGRWFLPFVLRVHSWLVGGVSALRDFVGGRWLSAARNCAVSAPVS